MLFSTFLFTGKETLTGWPVDSAVPIETGQLWEKKNEQERRMSSHPVWWMTNAPALLNYVSLLRWTAVEVSLQKQIVGNTNTVEGYYLVQLAWTSCQPLVNPVLRREIRVPPAVGAAPLYSLLSLLTFFC